MPAAPFSVFFSSVWSGVNLPIDPGLAVSFPLWDNKEVFSEYLTYSSGSQTRLSGAGVAQAGSQCSAIKTE